MSGGASPSAQADSLPGSSRGGWPRLPGWWPLGLGLGLLVMGLALWEVFPPGVWHDDGVYVLLGRALAHGEGLRYLGVVGSPPAPKFPPLYPLLLAGVWKAAPTFPQNVVWLAGLNLVLLAAAGGLFAAYAHRILGLPPLLAAGVTALAWISPSLWRTALIPLSEPLFLLLLVATLFAAARMEERPGTGGVLLFLLAGAAAYHARTAGVAVLAGGVAALLLSRRWRASAWAVAGVVGVVLPWALWSRAVAGSILPSLQDTLGPYGGWLLGQIRAAPGDFLASLPGNLGGLLSLFLSLQLPGVEGLPRWLGLLLLPICAWGLFRAGLKSPALPLTLMVAFGTLTLWPFQAVRLFAPLHPFLVLGTVLGFRALWASWRGSGWRSLPLAALGAAWLLAVVPMSLYRLGSGWTEEPYRMQAAALMEAVSAVEEKTPPDAVVGAPELWSGIHLFTGRTVIPSARFRPFSPDGPTWGSPEEQYRLWMETGVTHLVVEQGGMIHGQALDRVDALCPPGTVELLLNLPGLYLVKLAWDPDCQAKVLAPD